VHYKSELHLYNIKRRLLDLIPATPEQFDLKRKCKTINNSLKIRLILNLI
jgi:hypothetical protein